MKLNRRTLKRCAKILYTRFDMCTSILFSPFAGVLYTVSAFEKTAEKPESVPSPPVSHCEVQASPPGHETSHSLNNPTCIY